MAIDRDNLRFKGDNYPTGSEELTPYQKKIITSNPLLAEFLNTPTTSGETLSPEGRQLREEIMGKVEPVWREAIIVAGQEHVLASGVLADDVERFPSEFLRTGMALGYSIGVGMEISAMVPIVTRTLEARKLLKPNSRVSQTQSVVMGLLNSGLRLAGHEVSQIPLKTE